MNMRVDRHLAGFNTNLRQTSNSEGNIDRPIPDIEPPMATTSSSFVRASVNFDGFKDVLHFEVSISQLSFRQTELYCRRLHVSLYVS